MFNIFADPYAAARAFYGRAFDAIREGESKRLECSRVAARLVPLMHDEVAHQTPMLDDIWPTTDALMR